MQAKISREGSVGRDEDAAHEKHNAEISVNEHLKTHR
jgi:hypothetical protein